MRLSAAFQKREAEESLFKVEGLIHLFVYRDKKGLFKGNREEAFQAKKILKINNLQNQLTTKPRY